MRDRVEMHRQNSMLLQVAGCPSAPKTATIMGSALLRAVYATLGGPVAGAKFFLVPIIANHTVSATMEHALVALVLLVQIVHGPIPCPIPSVL